MTKANESFYLYITDICKCSEVQFQLVIDRYTFGNWWWHVVARAKRLKIIVYAVKGTYTLLNSNVTGV